MEREFRNGQYQAEDLEVYRREWKDKMEQAGLNQVTQEVQKQIDQWREKEEKNHGGT